MQIYLTFDYELYFGEQSGSVEKCILEPTQMLTEMANRQGIKLCQFVDIGFLIRMQEELKKFPSLNKDYSALCFQLESLWKSGHDLQLHIHPHWEDSFYDGNKWVCKVDRYKLGDFHDAEISDICQRYTKRLIEFTGPNEIYTFRAGGWCIQPFSKLKKALHENGIRVDSSVFNNGHYESELYQYDFRGAPLKSKWKFSDDPIIENEEGEFLELPISSIHNSPLFYWRLFLLGRLNPYMHKPLGDGFPVPAPGQRFKMLTRWTHNTVSVDGYNANLLWRAHRQHQRKNKNEMVVIGHPKALSRYGLKALEQFIIDKKAKNQFTVFRQQKSNLT